MNHNVLKRIDKREGQYREEQYIERSIQVNVFTQSRMLKSKDRMKSNVYWRGRRCVTATDWIPRLHQALTPLLDMFYDSGQLTTLNIYISDIKIN